MIAINKIKATDLNKCMEKIFNHCDEFGIWSDDLLTKYCENENHTNALFALQAQVYINVDVSNCEPETVILTDFGRSYFANKQSKRNEFILKSIIIPIIVSSITTLITMGITQLFS